MTPAQWETEIRRLAKLGVHSLVIPSEDWSALRESFGERIDPLRDDTLAEAERSVANGDRFVLAGVDVIGRFPSSGPMRWPPPAYVVRDVTITVVDVQMEPPPFRAGDYIGGRP